MGISMSSDDPSLIFNRENWTEEYEQPPTKRLHSSRNFVPQHDQQKYTLLRNKATGQHIYQFRLEFTQQDTYTSFLALQSLRNSSQYLIQGKHITNNHKTIRCMATYKIYLYIDHILVRLSAVNRINFTDSLHFLHNSINGFKQLFEEIGCFQISQQLICVTHEGVVRVWMNKDLSCIYGYFERQNSENIMIRNLIAIIEQKTSFIGRFANKFSQFIIAKIGNSKLTFKMAEMYFQEYVLSSGYSVAQSCQGVLNDTRKNKGLAESDIGIHQLLNRKLFHESEVKKMRVDDINLFMLSSACESFKTHVDRLKDGGVTGSNKKKARLTDSECIKEQEFEGSLFNTDLTDNIRKDERIQVGEGQQALCQTSRVHSPREIPSQQATHYNLSVDRLKRIHKPIVRFTYSNCKFPLKHSSNNSQLTSLTINRKINTTISHPHFHRQQTNSKNQLIQNICPAKQKSLSLAKDGKGEPKRQSIYDVISEKSGDIKMVLDQREESIDKEIISDLLKYSLLKE